jgi:hypothetical protein
MRRSPTASSHERRTLEIRDAVPMTCITVDDESNGDRHMSSETSIDIVPGEALIVPRGVWHLIRCVEPGQLVNITPGPNGEHRPVLDDRKIE